MSGLTFQKQAGRNLVISPNIQAAYGGVLADANLTVLQRFDKSTVFSRMPSNRTDQMMAGKGTEWATDDQITAWDSMGTLKNEGDAFLLGWMLALIFGQEVVTGNGPFTHTFTLPPVTATMPCTTVYVEESADVHRKFADMAAKSFSMDVPERGAISASLDMVGTGLIYPGSMSALPAQAVANYLLGSDFLTTITPAVGAVVPFSGRQTSTSISIDRGAEAYKSAGDGLYAKSVDSGQGKHSTSMVVAALQTDDINGWFESGERLSITAATLPGNKYQLGLVWPSVRVKAAKVTNTSEKVTWSISWDETSSIQVGNQSAVSAYIVNDCPGYLIPA